jgi:phosphate transport system substrate-binding protein
LAPLTRPLTDVERTTFARKYGYPPTEFRVALDAIGLFVHKDNPIRSLTLEQVDAIFSSTRRRGHREVRTWGDLGLGGEWAERPILLYGLNWSRGACALFRETALQSGGFKDEVRQQPGSASVVLAVLKEPGAIGFTGIGYRTDSVRAVPIAPVAGADPVEPTAPEAASGAYPLSQTLRIAVNRDPAKPFDPRVREFLRLVYTKQGQEAVAKDGHFPLPEKIASEERKKLE